MENPAHFCVEINRTAFFKPIAWTHILLTGEYRWKKQIRAAL